MELDALALGLEEAEEEAEVLAVGVADEAEGEDAAGAEDVAELAGAAVGAEELEQPPSRLQRKPE